MNTPKHIVIDGISFCRDDETGYYLNSELRTRAHRYVYEKFNGSIPPDHHVHHKDEDKSNNEIDNLELMLAVDHGLHHGLKNAENPEWLAWSRENMRVNARPAASEWHRSPAGREWHSKHAKEIFSARVPQDFKCEQCAEPFQTIDNGRVRFCSNACKSAYRRVIAVDDVSRVCTCCGSTFQCNKYRRTQTCSRSCTNRMRARTSHRQELR